MALDQEFEEHKDMSFLDHVEELRGHLIRSVIAIVGLAILFFVQVEFLFDTLIFGPKKLDFWTYRKLCELSDFIYHDDSLCIKEIGFRVQNVSISGQFSQHVFVAVIAGLICSFPYILWEFWRFIKPALSKKEKSHARGIVFYGTVLFALGILFGYYVLTPISLTFLGGYRISDEIANDINLESYISFVSTLTFATGLIFELPILVYFLAKIGLISSTFMKAYRRHAFVVIIVIAAILTPPDVMSQILMTIPLYALYEISIFVVLAVEKTERLKQRNE